MNELIELFKKYPGIAAGIRRSFAYHYDQIQREIESEVATINKDDAATIIDYTTKHMEESMGWLDPDDQTTYDFEIAEDDSHYEEIEYYLNSLEKPETPYTSTENTVNFFKSLIK